MSRWVVDSSAVLAYLRDEPGGEVVEKALNSSALSAVNAAEVMTKLIQRGEGSAVAAAVVASLAYRIVAVDADLGLAAGRIHAATRAFGLSLGDAVCLALAEREGLPALTADRAWAEIGIGVEVRVIR
ncbi:MAG: type II toxin-antitoxin system VapC family toxin [Caulobacteraceae bacterium]